MSVSKKASQKLDVTAGIRIATPEFITKNGMIITKGLDGDV